MSNRQEGYYWCKYQNRECTGFTWVVGYYGIHHVDEVLWRILGRDTKEEDVYEINETRIPNPDEVGLLKEFSDKYVKPFR